MVDRFGPSKSRVEKAPALNNSKMGTTPSTVPVAGAVPGANAVPGVPGANAVPGVLSTASSTPLPSGNSPFPPDPQRPHIQHQKGIPPGAYSNRRIGIMPLPFQSHYTLCVQHILKLLEHILIWFVIYILLYICILYYVYYISFIIYIYIYILSILA